MFIFRHFEEDAAENSTPPTPGKKIKLQPTTPSTAGAGVPAEEDHTSPTLPSAEANLSPSAPINNATNASNETQVKKGRKKVQTKQPLKSLNFITEVYYFTIIGLLHYYSIYYIICTVLE